MADGAMVEGTSFVEVTTLDMVEGFCNREISGLQMCAIPPRLPPLAAARHHCYSPSSLLAIAAALAITACCMSPLLHYTLLQPRISFLPWPLPLGPSPFHSHFLLVPRPSMAAHNKPFSPVSVAGQESIELLNLCETTDDIVQASSQAKITNVVVGTSAFCQQDQQQNQLVLSALKNVYHSLKRWGLEKDIKVSVAFHLDYLRLNSNSTSFNYDLKMVKPLMDFLQSVNSTYSIIPHSGFSHFSDKSLSLVSSHLESMKKLGFFYVNNINVAAIVPKGRKTITRKLSVVDSSLIGPSSSPYGFTLPPCRPIGNGSPYYHPPTIPV
ncbi:hypothetical protein SESBI_20034 [Sesbania bispinosa]|nr:hypothetical protein SESBI_20034 [Sesbania bispinosa]